MSGARLCYACFNESGLGSAPIVAAAATGLVLVNSGEWVKGLNGASLTKAAFSDFPGIGPALLTIGLLTFVFSTILGRSYYGEKAVEYLYGIKAISFYRWLWVGAVFDLPYCSQ